MAQSRNLFGTNHGPELAPEICLLIIDCVVDQCPKATGILMRVSKSIHYLLTTYRTSIIKAAISHDTRLAYVNSEQQSILSTAQMPLGQFTASRMSYNWLSEVRFRMETIEFLISHELTEMSDPQHRWPSLDVSKDELQKRISLFKKDGLNLLYRLADCAAGFKTKEIIRRRQAEFLEKESASDLAALGVMVEVMGQGYFSMTQNALQTSGLLNVSGFQFSSLSDSQFYKPSSVPWQDLGSQNWIRECMCVFEDLIQRYGPCYAYAYVGFKQKTRRPDLWARIKLQDGLDNMNAFEMGHTMSYASLQSVVWHVFCRKSNCTLSESWVIAKEMVERRMTEYRTDIVKGV